MKNKKQFFFRCYLSLLRFRLEYATGVLCRASRRWNAMYQATLSRAFQRLSLWECHYNAQVRRYLTAGQEEQTK